MKSPAAPAPVTAPHAHAPGGVGEIMWTVILALVPALLFGIYMFGWPTLWLVLITLAATLVGEAFALRLVGRPVGPTLGDGSALLTGILLAMTLPPWAPWWVGVVGGLFAILVGKHIFGGLGNNLFNPAMLGRVMLLIAFPLQLTTWPDIAPLHSAAAPSLAESLAITFGGAAIDGVTGASPLGHIKTALTQGIGVSSSAPEVYSFIDGLFGSLRGSLGETSALLVLLGGLWLLYKKVITWEIPVSMLLAVALPATLLHLVDAERYAGPLFHLTTGALMLGAFFIATDMVTSPSSRLGQIVFGAGCGLLVFIIRTWGGFPEGVAFAVLLMNAATPVIDHYTRPRIYGRDRQGKPLNYDSEKEGRS